MTKTLQPTADFNELVSSLISVVDGELSTKSRVVDALLDLRNAAGEPLVRTRIDELLAGIPGINTVPNGWWIDRLEELRTFD